LKKETISWKLTVLPKKLAPMLNLNFYFTHAVFLRGNILFSKLFFVKKSKVNYKSNWFESNQK
jgi:hypothetical protein